MTAFQMDLKKFEKLNTQVLGVSPDTLKTHQQFTEKYDLHFPLIADEQGTIARLYASGRITFIINKAGIIRYIQKGVPNTSVLLEELEKLRE
jgi:peroxiredoxin Q/BCP